MCGSIRRRLLLSLPARGERAGERGSHARQTAGTKIFVLHSQTSLNCGKSWQNSGGVDKHKRVSNHGKHRNNLYYLLPGMGRGARKRFWRNMLLGVLVGLLVSLLMAWLFWLAYAR